MFKGVHLPRSLVQPILSDKSRELLTKRETQLAVNEALLLSQTDRASQNILYPRGIYSADELTSYKSMLPGWDYGPTGSSTGNLYGLNVPRSNQTFEDQMLMGKQVPGDVLGFYDTDWSHSLAHLGGRNHEDSQYDRDDMTLFHALERDPSRRAYIGQFEKPSLLRPTTNTHWRAPAQSGITDPLTTERMSVQQFKQAWQDFDAKLSAISDREIAMTMKLQDPSLTQADEVKVREELNQLAYQRTSLNQGAAGMQGRTTITGSLPGGGLRGGSAAANANGVGQFLQPAPVQPQLGSNDQKLLDAIAIFGVKLDAAIARPAPVISVAADPLISQNLARLTTAYTDLKASVAANGTVSNSSLAALVTQINGVADLARNRPIPTDMSPIINEIAGLKTAVAASTTAGQTALSQVVDVAKGLQDNYIRSEAAIRKEFMEVLLKYKADVEALTYQLSQKEVALAKARAEVQALLSRPPETRVIERVIQGPSQVVQPQPSTAVIEARNKQIQDLELEVMRLKGQIQLVIQEGDLKLKAMEQANNFQGVRINELKAEIEAIKARGDSLDTKKLNELERQLQLQQNAQSRVVFELSDAQLGQVKLAARQGAKAGADEVITAFNTEIRALLTTFGSKIDSALTTFTNQKTIDFKAILSASDSISASAAEAKRLLLLKPSVDPVNQTLTADIASILSATNQVLDQVKKSAIIHIDVDTAVKQIPARLQSLAEPISQNFATNAQTLVQVLAGIQKLESAPITDKLTAVDQALQNLAGEFRQNIAVMLTNGAITVAERATLQTVSTRVGEILTKVGGVETSLTGLKSAQETLQNTVNTVNASLGTIGAALNESFKSVMGHFEQTNKANADQFQNLINQINVAVRVNPESLVPILNKIPEALKFILDPELEALKNSFSQPRAAAALEKIRIYEAKLAELNASLGAYAAQSQQLQVANRLLQEDVFNTKALGRQFEIRVDELNQINDASLGELARAKQAADSLQAQLAQSNAEKGALGSKLSMEETMSATALEQALESDRKLKKLEGEYLAQATVLAAKLEESNKKYRALSQQKKLTKAVSTAIRRVAKKRNAEVEKASQLKINIAELQSKLSKTITLPTIPAPLSNPFAPGGDIKESTVPEAKAASGQTSNGDGEIKSNLADLGDLTKAPTTAIRDLAVENVQIDAAIRAGPAAYERVMNRRIREEKLTEQELKDSKFAVSAFGFKTPADFVFDISSLMKGQLAVRELLAGAKLAGIAESKGVDYKQPFNVNGDIPNRDPGLVRSYGPIRGELKEGTDPVTWGPNGQLPRDAQYPPVDVLNTLSAQAAAAAAVQHPAAEVLDQLKAIDTKQQQSADTLQSIATQDQGINLTGQGLSTAPTSFPTLGAAGGPDIFILADYAPTGALDSKGSAIAPTLKAFMADTESDRVQQMYQDVKKKQRNTENSDASVTRSTTLDRVAKQLAKAMEEAGDQSMSSELDVQSRRTFREGNAKKRERS
jgi:hypothetical protein